MNFADMPASHFIFIPAVLLIGVIVGWILGSRAAKDAYAVELKRRDERELRKNSTRKGSHEGSGGVEGR